MNQINIYWDGWEMYADYAFCILSVTVNTKESFTAFPPKPRHICVWGCLDWDIFWGLAGKLYYISPISVYVLPNTDYLAKIWEISWVLEEISSLGQNVHNQEWLFFFSFILSLTHTKSGHWVLEDPAFTVSRFEKVHFNIYSKQTGFLFSFVILELPLFCTAEGND